MNHCSWGGGGRSCCVTDVPPPGEGSVLRRYSSPVSSRMKMRAARIRLAAALALFVASACGSRAEVIDDVLSSLSLGVSFLERQHEHINLDGAVGFVLLQAELKEAVGTWPHTDPVSWAQRTSAVALLRRLDQALDKAFIALKRNDPKYYKEFEPLLSWTFWKIPAEGVSTDPSLVYPSTMSAECYDEQLSDKCLTLLLGTWKENGTPCIVTKPCLDTMTRFGCPHYSLSHQLLYFLVGRMGGCSNLLKGDTRASRANVTEQQYQNIFCSNMMKTNQDVVAAGLTEQTVDIFTENILICGLAGFSDFFKADWLQHILGLQDKEVGCFGRDHSILSQIIGDELLEQLQPHRRVKRREKILPDGCSSHMTAVAVGALGGYLNFYLTEQDITKRPLS
uniref:Chromosome 16 open reading frame 89 n=1 Tax=Oryzias sinensis TaxID=183150 RepID=A0A8C8DNT7_9TELE